MIPLPPALAAIVAEALMTHRPADPSMLQTMFEQDPASLKALAYRDLPKLNAALAEFDALPDDTPHRAKIAAVLVSMCVQSSIGDLDNFEYLDRAAALAKIAATDPDAPAEWRTYFALLRSQTVLHRLREGAVVREPRAIIAELEAYGDLVDTMPAEIRQITRDAIGTVVSMLTAHATHLENNPAEDAERRRRLEDLRGRATNGSNLRMRVDALLEILDLKEALRRRDRASVQASIQNVYSVGGQLSATDPFRLAFETGLPTTLLYTSIGAEAPDQARPWAQVSPANRQELERLSQDPSLSEAKRAAHLFALAMIRMQESTPQSMDEAVDLCAKALPMIPPEHYERARYLAQAGLVRLARWQEFGDPQDQDELRAGIAPLTRAWDLAAENGDYRVLTGIARMLSQAYHLDGRLDLAHATALTGLRGHVWSTLLQPRAAGAHAVAQDAGADAYYATSMFLKSRRPELAAWALEMGRGLIIHAATQTRDAAARLDELGEIELAREWRGAIEASGVDQIPNVLRRRVMSALTGVALAPDGSLAADFAAAMAAVPDPPSAHEIRAALVALERDALVYLVPGQGVGHGVAAVIPATEDPAWISLPELKSERLAGFERSLANGMRDLSPESGGRSGAEALEEVCDWAWHAAIAPVLELLETPADRPLRVVLIPVRELARVPWHAARRLAGGRIRHAVEDVVFSYAASARSLCASAWSREASTGGGPSLIVSDPDSAGQGSPLVGARVEAAAIRTCFYPEARFLGRETDGSDAPDGRGLPGEVRGWLEDPQGGAVLHLACHAAVRAGMGARETSFLLLADGQRLSAEEIIDALGASGHQGPSLAVLAACSSGESGRGYDEAFSLATAFLSRGTRSVISTLWSVSDADTPALMFMFHYFLREHGLQPSDALREAQLWTIRGGDLPDAAPEELRAVSASRSASDLGLWAAFVHFGR